MHNPTTNNAVNTVLPGQEYYVAETDESGLGAVDAVADDRAPSSQWGEAWKYLRRRPLFWVAAALILMALAVAIAPQLFTCLLYTSDAADDAPRV